MKYPDDFEIYSPESSDGTHDWPTKIIMGIVVILIGATIIYFVGKWPIGFGAWW